MERFIGRNQLRGDIHARYLKSSMERFIGSTCKSYVLRGHEFKIQYGEIYSFV